MLRSRLVGSDERQIDICGHRRGQLDLRLLRGFFQPLQRHLVLREIDALIFLELVNDPIDQTLVDVVAAEVGVAICRFDFNDTLADFENRDVERTATEIVDGDRLILLFVEAIRERCRGGLVHEALDLEAGDLARVLGRLTLRIVKVRRHGDHRAINLLAEVVFGGLLQLLKDHRGDLRRRVQLALHFDARISVRRSGYLVRHHLHLFVHFLVLATHESFDREDGVLGIGDRLTLGHLSDEAFSALGERDDRGGQPAAFGVDDDFGLIALHHRDDGVCRPEVNANNLGHNLLSLKDLALILVRFSQLMHSIKPESIIVKFRAAIAAPGQLLSSAHKT